MKKTLYSEIAEKIEAYIKEKNLHPGDKLPTHREFAQMMDVSTQTVSNAVEKLHHKGVVDIRPQSGVFVMQDAWAAMFPRQFNWYEYFNRSKKLPIQFLKSFKDKQPKYILSHIAIMNEHWFPLLADAMARAGKKTADMQTDANAMLKDMLVDKMRLMGVEVQQGNLLLTREVNYSLLSIILTFFSPGTVCYFISPSTFEVSAVFDITGTIREPIPAGTDGVDLNYFTQKIRKKQKSFFLIMPQNHAMSGTTMSMDKRRKLYNICYSNSIPIIELDDYRDVSENPLPPIKAIDKHEIVFYVGSWSKLFASTVDIGWIVASAELIDRLSVVQFSQWFNLSAPVQNLLYNILTYENYGAYIESLKDVLQKRRQVMNELLTHHLGNIATWDKNFELFFWLQFREWIDVKKMCAESEVLVMTDSNHYAFGPQNAMFISITALDEGLFEEIVQLIATAAKKAIVK